MKQKLFILNLVSVFVVAFGLTTFIHEFAHALTGLALIVIVLFFRKLTPVLAKFLFLIKSETEFESNPSFKFLFLLPISIGTAINILISLPAPTMIRLAFPMAIPLTFIPSEIRLYKSSWSSEKKLSNESDFSKITYWPILAMLLIIVFSRILVIGINI